MFWQKMTPVDTFDHSLLVDARITRPIHMAPKAEKAPAMAPARAFASLRHFESAGEMLLKYVRDNPRNLDMVFVSAEDASEQIEVRAMSAMVAAQSKVIADMLKSVDATEVPCKVVMPDFASKSAVEAFVDLTYLTGTVNGNSAVDVVRKLSNQDRIVALRLAVFYDAEPVYNFVSRIITDVIFKKMFPEFAVEFLTHVPAVEDWRDEMRTVCECSVTDDIARRAKRLKTSGVDDEHLVELYRVAKRVVPDEPLASTSMQDDGEYEDDDEYE
jgi:hypothetical protein